jgi:hypothetical protein
MRAARRLPQSHLTSDGRDVIKLGLALIATLVALVLGLMIATAKGSFDAQSASVRQLAGNMLLLDRLLAEYGPDAEPARGLLHTIAVKTEAALWPPDGARPASLAPGEARPETKAFLAALNGLAAVDNEQLFVKARSLQLATDLAAARLQLYIQSGNALPRPFLLVLATWLLILFAGYGLMAPRNATVVGVLLACSLAVTGAMFLILELADPFAGLLRVSEEPMRQAISLMGQ